MKKLKIWTTFALLFCFAGVAPAGASDASMDRMVAQIESLFPPMEGVVVSVDDQILTLDLKLGQPINKGDRLNLIHFGSDIIHPVSKKKIGRKETDLGEVEVLEVRQNFSLAKLLDPTVLARPGDGVRSPFNTLSFLVAPPSIGVSKKIDRDRLRLELEKKLADHPRFNVPVFELGLWLLENNLDVPNLLKKKNLRKLSSHVKADFLLVPSVKSVKKKLVLGYKLYSAQTGQLQKEAQILSNQLPIKQAEQKRSRRGRDIQRDFSRPNEGLLEYVGKQEFRFKIVDFDVGDINGDGREELIVVAPNRVIVYSYKNKNLKQALTFRADNENHKFLGVDVGDINRNGRDEIFVTDQLGDSLSSFVLEARPGKKRLERTWRDVNLFFRIIHPFGKKPTLLAQSPGVNTPFHGPIKKMVFSKGRYVTRSNLKLPSIYGVDFILYGLTSVDINGDGKDEIVMLDKDYHLRVYSASGRVLVQSNEYYGNDPRFIDVASNNIGTITQEGKPVRFRGRLQFIRQGKNRYLLLPKNISAGGSFLPGLNLDLNSSVVVLGLSQEGLEKSFETKKQKGYLAAYQVVSAGENLPVRLHKATVEERALGGKTISTIYTYLWRTED